jgi:hypothetical protein
MNFGTEYSISVLFLGSMRISLIFRSKVFILIFLPSPTLHNTTDCRCSEVLTYAHENARQATAGRAR